MRILKIFGIIIISIIALLYITGFAIRYKSADFAKKDVEYLFKKNNIDFQKLKCSVPGVLSRQSSCKFISSNKQIEYLVEKFKLEKVEKNNQKRFLGGDGYFSESDLGACGISDSSKVDVYHSRMQKAKETELKLNNGAAFEKMILFYNPNEESFCIQIGYAYG